MRNTVVVDSGPLIALFCRRDVWHEPVVAFLREHPRLRLLTTWAVLHEASALLGSRVGKQAELDFLAWVERGGLTIASQEASAIQGIRALIEKYRDLPFDFADASVAVLAAESGIEQVLTLDRDFDIYRDARGKRLKNLLQRSL
jgi:predicted nucleic acid-binding protein